MSHDGNYSMVVGILHLSFQGPQTQNTPTTSLKTLAVCSFRGFVLRSYAEPSAQLLKWTARAVRN